MPRTDGVYTPPAGTKGVPDTTIRSAPYNALVDDLTADANNARPITAGGTGATNATDARENLGAIASADILASPLKDAPVDADGLVVTDSEDEGNLKRVLWSKVKALINLTSVGATVAAANGKATPADGDFVAGVEAGGSTMYKITWGNIKTWIKSWIVKADVGLGNVDNTSDANKPISTATQNALDGKLNLSGGVLTGALRTISTFEVRAVIPKIYMISPGAVIGYRMEANISDTVDGGWRVANGYSGSAILEAFSSGKVNIPGWLEVSGMGNVKTYVDSQSYARTKDYMLAETLPVGGYAFAKKILQGTIQPYSTVAGSDLDLAGTTANSGGIGFGTWQVVGATLSPGNATLVKRIA
ncbi:hypothetical protein [Ochrobactrum sp. AP1BH01-1]|uniref:hypothetical protein n=1 Tax=Ochrobactrum sp. AP1BH01-1 TaxID=2823874 RepID=UPI002570B74A|nr:hypothetical protein [Ochrobactrum sp. AP1BH01-1]